MAGILNFMLAVIASIIAYYICKWIDDQRRNGR